MKILENSEITYELNNENKPFKNFKKFEKLNTPDLYQSKQNGKIVLKKFEITSEIKSDFDAAESYFLKKDLKNARKYYQKVLDKKTGFSMIMTFIGQTYGLEKDYKNAKEWYLKAIQSNYIDYMAHWFLSSIYEREGNHKEAVLELATAHVLNRNNPRIIEELKELLSLDGMTYENWYFTPLIEITQTSKDKIRLNTYDIEWLYYGICRLIWEKEPGYREKRLGKNSVNTLHSSIETNECLTYLVLQQKIAKTEKTKNEQIQTLLGAFEKKQIPDFTVYEIFLPENPSVSLTLPKDQIESIINYVLNTRLVKKQSKKLSR